MGDGPDCAGGSVPHAGAASVISQGAVEACGRVDSGAVRAVPVGLCSDTPDRPSADSVPSRGISGSEGRFRLRAGD